MTFGEERIRVSFNPSKTYIIDILKARAAELLDLYHDTAMSRHPHSDEYRMWAKAMDAVEEASMWAIKAVTYDE